MLPRQLEPQTHKRQSFVERDTLVKQRYARDFDRRHGVKDLPTLRPGDPVRIKLDNEKIWSKTGQVIDSHTSPRSFMIDTGDGVYRRNRKHLAKVPNPSPTVPRSETQPETLPGSTGEDGVPEQNTKPDVAVEVPILRRSERQTRLPTKFANYDMR